MSRVSNAPVTPASGPLAPGLRPTRAEIDGSALAHNLARVCARVDPRCRILAVVKADAYGHGAVLAARSLVEAGAWGLAVSLVEEALELRVAGIATPVVVLGGVVPGSESLLVRHHLRPVVWTIEHLERVAAAATQVGAAVSVHLKIDTGMSRLGALPSELAPLMEWLRRDGGQRVFLEGVMTHLACADDPADETGDRQIETFSACLGTLTAAGLTPTLRHVCNSAGLMRLPKGHFDMVRPGVALYGAASSDAVLLDDLRPAMAFHSRVVGLRRLPAGARVSYGGRHLLTRDSVLAIVPVGYGDGYMRGVSGRAEMLVRGARCPVLGNVTMDVCMVDVTDIQPVAEGEQVTLFGRQGDTSIHVHEVAAWAGVLPYEIMCAVSKRVPRHLVADD